VEPYSVEIKMSDGHGLVGYQLPRNISIHNVYTGL